MRNTGPALRQDDSDAADLPNGFFLAKESASPARRVKGLSPYRAVRIRPSWSSGCGSPTSIEGKGMVYRMRDGSVVSHRHVSSSKDGSPVVELKVKNASGIKSQKIHFVRKGK